MTGIEIQKVWRTESASIDGAFRVWEAVEVIGTPNKEWYGIVECRDGSFIFVHCMNFWTKKDASHAYHFADMYQENILIK